MDQSEIDDLIQKFNA
jgi:NAD-dependent SIR2 family protein deacetylase